MTKRRDRLVCLLCLICLCAPAPAAAQSTDLSINKQKVRALFTQGETAYRVGKFDEALGHFLAALKLYSRASIVLNVAQCYRQLNQTNQALFYYKLYMTQWQREHPDKPSPYSEEVTRHIATLKALAKRNSRSTLVLSSQPTGARIWLDGRELAMTSPTTLKDLSPGEHSVVLRQDDLMYRGSVDLKPGQQTELVAVLEKIEAEVVVISDPSGAEVLLQGRSAGRTPLTLKLPLGQVTLELRKELRVTARRLVKVEGPQRMEVKVPLAQVGIIAVASEPSGATVYLDGRSVGITPAELVVDPGLHKVRVERPGRDAVVRELTIKPGQNVQVTEALPLTKEMRDRLSKRRTFRGVGWTAIALGIAGILTGATLVTYGYANEDEASRDYLEASVQSKMDAAYDRMERGRDFVTYGGVVGGLSVALLTAGSVLVGLAPDALTETQVVKLRPGPGVAGLALGGTF